MEQSPGAAFSLNSVPNSSPIPINIAEEICSTYPLTPSQATDLIAMTPLTQGIEKEQLDLAALKTVTIHMHILAGRPR